MSNHSGTQPLWPELATTLNHDMATATQLLTLLEQERASLEQRDYDQFKTIVDQKPPLLKSLEQHASYRQQLLAQLGFEDEESTLQAAKYQFPEIAPLWTSLRELWQQCQHLNSVNERIAQRTHLVVSEVLNILRGQNGQTKLYTSTGNQQASSTGRPISSA